MVMSCASRLSTPPTRPRLNCIVLGDSAVGKSCLCRDVLSSLVTTTSHLKLGHPQQQQQQQQQGQNDQPRHCSRVSSPPPSSSSLHAGCCEFVQTAFVPRSSRAGPPPKLQDGKDSRWNLLMRRRHEHFVAKKKKKKKKKKREANERACTCDVDSSNQNHEKHHQLQRQHMQREQEQHPYHHGGQHLPVDLHVYDTVGDEEFEDVMPTFHVGDGDVVLLCFAVISPSSFHNLKMRWLPIIRDAYRDIVTPPRIVLVGTKKDLRDNDSILSRLRSRGLAPISAMEAHHLRKDIGALAYVEVSTGDYTSERNRKESERRIAGMLQATMGDNRCCCCCGDGDCDGFGGSFDAKCVVTVDGMGKGKGKGKGKRKGKGKGTSKHVFWSSGDSYHCLDDVCGDCGGGCSCSGGGGDRRSSCCSCGSCGCGGGGGGGGLHRIGGRRKEVDALAAMTVQRTCADADIDVLSVSEVVALSLLIAVNETR